MIFICIFALRKQTAIYLLKIVGSIPTVSLLYEVINKNLVYFKTTFSDKINAEVALIGRAPDLYTE